MPQNTPHSVADKSKETANKKGRMIEFCEKDHLIGISEEKKNLLFCSHNSDLPRYRL